LDDFLPFQERVARFGFYNSLVQTTLKLTLPGMPDIYQGAELWDLSLVDPDNRRAVDYPSRSRRLAEIMAAPEHDRVTAMLKNWRDGGCKLAVTAALLGERRRNPMLFAEGDYEPLAVSGSKTDHICAFARSRGDCSLLVAVARFPVRLQTDPDWDGTEIACPKTADGVVDWGVTRWRDLLNGRVVECREGRTLPARLLFGDLPVAVLVRVGDGS
jgi:(1->4)-alpha-D-glucan 1-alpha-D-glucosylmutase